MSSTYRTAALQDKLPTLFAQLLVLQQKCTSWYQYLQLQPILNCRDPALTYTSVGFLSYEPGSLFCPEDAPSCFYCLQGTVRFLNLLCASSLEPGNILSWKGPTRSIQCKVLALHRTPSNARPCLSCPRAEPSSPVTVLEFIHFEQQLTAAAVSRSIDVMVPLLQQSKQDTISSHTRQPFPQRHGLESSISSAKLEFCRSINNRICGALMRH